MELNLPNNSQYRRIHLLLWVLTFTCLNGFLRADPPLCSFSESAVLRFIGSTSVLWDSNIFRDENEEESDITYVFTPGLELNLGSPASGREAIIRASYDILHYQENDQLDKNNFHTSASGQYKRSRLDLNGSIRYDEKQITSGETNRSGIIIETEDIKGALYGEYGFSPKFSFGAGVDYFDRSFVSESRYEFADRSYVSFPFDLYYKWTPKMDLSLGYTYKIGEVDDYKNVEGYDYTSHFFNMGARGNLLPKISGFFKVGYRNQDSDDSSGRKHGSDGQLGIDGGLTWNATPKSIYNIVLERDFGVGGEGTVTEVSRVRLSSDYSLTPNWSASYDIGYTLRDYLNNSNDNRKDRQYLFSAGLNYASFDYWTIRGGYRFHENDSNFQGYNYTSHSLYLTAEFRY